MNIKKQIQLIYEMEAPPELMIAAYLDCEHFYYLHQKAIKKVNIVWQANQKICWEQVWQFFGIKIGHELQTEYVTPSSFENSEMKAYPAWLPSFHHLFRIKTRTDFYSLSNGSKTLSVTKIDISFPNALTPIYPILAHFIKKFKIILDMEDAAMVHRKMNTFGPKSINHFLHKDQFFIFKEAFEKSFNSREISNFNPPVEYLNKRYPNIFDLDYYYVRSFIKKRFKVMTGYRYIKTGNSK